MNKKIKSILLCIFSCIFITASATSLFSVYSKYVSEKGGSGDIGDDTNNDLPYEIGSSVVVNTQEELFEALQYGYSYVQLGDELKNPFIVTEDVKTMSSSLILDLNGKEIQRNSREPMLNIPSGVSLTIIDSDAEKTGGLYNPVGSVLNVEGGTLTASAGSFECGPRPTEYYSSENGSKRIAKDRDGNDRQIEMEVFYYAEDNVTTVTEKKLMPVFNPELKGTYVDGNVYFDVNWTGKEFTIAADTYCYFVTSDGFSSGETIAFDKTAADFSYSYYAYPGTYQYLSVGEPSGTLNTDYVKITIYGYEKDIETAKSSSYAAVRMKDGTFNVNVTTTGVNNSGVSADMPKNPGCFYSYFGVEQASCVYIEGGVMNVNTTGTFSTVDPEIVENINKNGLAVNGKDSCIRTAIDNTGSLNILNGTYRSYIGDTVQMYQGDINVTGGEFIKDASSISNDDTNYATNGSAIYLYGTGADGGANMTVTGSGTSNIKFTLKGSGVSGIRCENAAYLNATNIEFAVEQKGTNIYHHNIGIYNYKGRVEVAYSTFTFRGHDSVGIFSGQSRYVTTPLPEALTGTVTVTDSDFIMSGETSRGIFAERGIVTVNSGHFSMTGAKSTGVAAAGGTVNLGTATGTGYTTANTVFFYIDHVADCYGVKLGLNVGESYQFIYYNQSDDHTATANLNSVQVFVGQGTGYSTSENSNLEGKFSNCAGIYTGNGMTNAEVNVTRGLFCINGNYSAGIFSRRADITQTGAGHKLVIFSGRNYKGYSNGGKVDGKWLIVSRSESDYIQGFTGNFEDGKVHSTFGIASLGGSITADNLYIKLSGSNANGMYVANKDAAGGITDGGNITIGDFQGDFDDNTGDYLTTSVLSVIGGTVSLTDGNVSANGRGILINGGGLNCDGKFYLKSTRLNAVFVSDGSITFSDTADVTIDTEKDKDSEYTAISWEQGASVYHYDAVEVRGGNFTSTGALTIKATGVENDDRVYDNQNGYQKFSDFAVKSFALNVSAATNATVSILKANISNTCGGGISVENGTLTLGDTAHNDIKVETTGNITYNTDIKDKNSWNDNWNYKWSKSGGYAVSVKGGTLEIFGGTYTALLGSGIVVKDGNATIHGGMFGGAGGAQAGPAGSYGLSMLGGKLTVDGGTFGGSTGDSLGIMLRGNSKNAATLTFNAGTVNTAGDNAAVCVYEYSTSKFGGDSENSDIKISGGSSAFTIENSGLEDKYEEKNTNVTINGGSYQCTRRGTNLWTNVIYTAVQTAHVRITGGTFTTQNGGKGITFNAGTPTDFKISGGTFDTKNGTFDGNGNNFALSNIILTGYAAYNAAGNQITATNINGVGNYAEIY